MLPIPPEVSTWNTVYAILEVFMTLATLFVLMSFMYLAGKLRLFDRSKVHLSEWFPQLYNLEKRSESEEYWRRIREKVLKDFHKK